MSRKTKDEFLLEAKIEVETGRFRKRPYNYFRG